MQYLDLTGHLSEEMPQIAHIVEGHYNKPTFSTLIFNYPDRYYHIADIPVYFVGEDQLGKSIISPKKGTMVHIPSVEDFEYKVDKISTELKGYLADLDINSIENRDKDILPAADWVGQYRHRVYGAEIFIRIERLFYFVQSERARHNTMIPKNQDYVAFVVLHELAHAIMHTQRCNYFDEYILEETLAEAYALNLINQDWIYALNTKAIFPYCLGGKMRCIKPAMLVDLIEIWIERKQCGNVSLRDRSYAAIVKELCRNEPFYINPKELKQNFSKLR